MGGGSGDQGFEANPQTSEANMNGIPRDSDTTGWSDHGADPVLHYLYSYHLVFKNKYTFQYKFLRGTCSLFEKTIAFPHVSLKLIQSTQLF